MPDRHAKGEGARAVERGLTEDGQLTLLGYSTIHGGSTPGQQDRPGPEGCVGGGRGLDIVSTAGGQDWDHANRQKGILWNEGSRCRQPTAK